jgi:hypothetical protein
LLQGRSVLEAIRGTSEVDAEYGTIINAYRRGMVERENQVTTIMRQEYRPHVAMSIICPLFQQVCNALIKRTLPWTTLPSAKKKKNHTHTICSVT